MDTLKNILTRRTIRSFEDRPIEKEHLKTILTAGMSGPSCSNKRDWFFIVVEDNATLNKMADANGKPAGPLRTAPMGILVCGDLERAYPRAKDYWVIDGSIACQNMTLAARSLGIGSVWLGTWPQTERVDGLRELFNLPENVIPHSILALGYSKDTEILDDKNAYEEDRVHYEGW